MSRMQLIRVINEDKVLFGAEKVLSSEETYNHLTCKNRVLHSEKGDMQS